MGIGSRFLHSVFFRHFVDGSSEYLARTWLTSPEEAETRQTRGRTPSSKSRPWNGRDFYVVFGNLDREAPNRLEASTAKAYGPPTAERVIRRCLHLLGPKGTSTDLLLEKWYRDSKILDIFEGSGQIMRVLISRD